MANPADPTHAVVQILAALVGAQLAAEWAPHAVVLLAGALGAYFCFLGQPQCSLLRAFAFVASWTAVAWLSTSAVTALIVRLSGLPVQADEITALVALCVGWVGPRWPDLAGGILARLPLNKPKDVA